MAITLTVWPISVEVADPAMPSSGNGPMPRMSSGLRTMSSTTASAMKKNGVRESPAPRSTVMTKDRRFIIGTATKMMRR